MSIFRIPVKRPKSNYFGLSHNFKFSGKMGHLIPVMAMDVVPGDRITLSVNSLFRLMPLVSPVMHSIKIKMSFYFVPNRILCPTWEAFIAEAEPGEEPAPPEILWQPTSVAPYSIGGMMGLPQYPSGENYTAVSAYPIAAYLKIYDEYYRPQQFTQELFQPLVPGTSNPSTLDWAQALPLSTNWQHDYFTSALPHAQWGASPVRIPSFTEDPNVYLNDANTATFFVTPDGEPSEGATIRTESAGGAVATFTDGSGDELRFDPAGTLSVDTAGAETGTIDDLVRANALQNWLRKVARGGSRYFERIMSDFGIKSPDSRLQRPEFIGSVRQQMLISEVLSTAETDAPIGQMAGHGISSNDSGRMSYHAKEHGWIIGILSIIPESAYQQGVPRKWTRKTRFDYFIPAFANIGEQEIKAKEIYADQSQEDQEATWGYTPRYAEYKVEHSRVAGDLQTTLDFWHLGRIFDAPPALAHDFIRMDPDDFNRIFADVDGDHFVSQLRFSVGMVRPMPRFGIPAL